MPDVNIGVLLGEIGGELSVAAKEAGLGRPASAYPVIDWQLDLIGGVIARHVGETVANDPAFPIRPLPVRDGDARAAEMASVLLEPEWIHDEVVEVSDSEAMRALLDLWIGFPECFPSASKQSGLDRHTVALLIAEDIELRDLVSQYLRLYDEEALPEQEDHNRSRLKELRGSVRARVGRMNGGRVIELADVLDGRLANAVPTSIEGERILKGWRRYRSDMRKMADLLHVLTDVPIRDYAPPEF